MCLHVQMYSQVQMPSEARGAFYSLELEIERVVSLWMWGLGTEFPSSERALHSFNHWAVSQPYEYQF